MAKMAANMFDKVPTVLIKRTGCCYPVTECKPHLFCNADGKIYGLSIYCDVHRKLMINPQYHGRAVRRADQITIS